MKINLQIDHLILEDIDLSYGERLLLQAAVEDELLHLLTANALPPHLPNSITIRRLPANVNITQGNNPTQMGQQIAQSIYQGMSESEIRTK